MSTINDYQIVEAMTAMGGWFIVGLGRLWYAADETNRQKLKAAFPDEWEEYREMVEIRKQRSAV